MIHLRNQRIATNIRCRANAPVSAGATNSGFARKSREYHGNPAKHNTARITPTCQGSFAPSPQLHQLLKQSTASSSGHEALILNLQHAPLSTRSRRPGSPGLKPRRRTSPIWRSTKFTVQLTGIV